MVARQASYFSGGRRYFRGNWISNYFRRSGTSNFLRRSPPYPLARPVVFALRCEQWHQRENARSESTRSAVAGWLRSKRAEPSSHDAHAGTGAPL